MNIRKRLFLIYKASARILAGHRIGELYSIGVVHRFIVSSLKPDFVIVQGNNIFIQDDGTLNLSDLDITDLNEVLGIENIQGLKNINISYCNNLTGLSEMIISV